MALRGLEILIRGQPRRLPQLDPLGDLASEASFEFLRCRAERLLPIREEAAAHLGTFRDGGNLAVDQVESSAARLWGS